MVALIGAYKDCGLAPTGRAPNPNSSRGAATRRAASPRHLTRRLWYSKASKNCSGVLVRSAIVLSRACLGVLLPRDRIAPGASAIPDEKCHRVLAAGEQQKA